MAYLAELWNSPSVGAARQRVRRAIQTITSYAEACHSRDAGHRVVGLSSLALPPSDGPVTAEQWLEHSAADQLEDSSREELHLDSTPVARQRYRGNLAREIAVKLKHYRRLS